MIRSLATRPGFWWSIIGVVLLLSLAAVIFLTISEQREQREFQEKEAERVSVVLNTMATFSVGQLRSLAIMSANEPRARPDDFGDVTAPLRLSHPAASFSYMEVVRGDSRAAARRQGVRFDGVEVFAVDATVPGPFGLLRPRRGHRDELSEMLKQAASTGAMAVTPGIRLAGLDGHHLVLAHPVEGQPVAGAPDGYIAAVMPIRSLLVGGGLVAPEGTELALVSRDGTTFGTEVRDDYGTGTLFIGDRAWELRLAAPGTASIHVPVIVGVFGLLIALGLTAILITWSRRERAAIELASRRLDERDRALRAEAETSRMYRLLAEYMTDLVSVASTEGRVRYISPAAETMLGWRPEEMVGRRLEELVHPEDVERNRSRVEAMFQTPSIDTFEHRVLCKDGSYIWVETACRSVEDSELGTVVELQATSRDISERKPLQQQLERLAWEDSLTGLGNRRRFTEALETENARAVRGGTTGAVMMIDIDEFKHVNDSHGHLVGDLVIQDVASAIRNRVRASDVLARLGGDEFAAILPETSLEQAEIVARDMVASVNASSAGSQIPDVTVSIGLAEFGAGGPDDPQLAYDRADKAMYRAKSTGRDRIVVDRGAGDSLSRHSSSPG